MLARATEPNSPWTRRAATVPALAALLVGAATARADTVRVRTDRGTFLVEVNAPGITVRGDGEQLVVTQAGGDEIRLRLDSETAERSMREPALILRRDDRVIVSARRIRANAVPATAAGPGRAVLGGPAGQSAWSVAIAPDGRALLAGHQNSVRLWTLPALTERFIVPTKTTVRRVAMTPDGATIATAEHQQLGNRTVGSVVIRDGKTGEARRAMDPIDGLHCVAIAPDGKVAASSNWIDGKIQVWDVTKGEQVGTLEGHTGPVGTVVFSPDGKTLASGGDTTVRLWDADTGAIRATFRGHQKAVESVGYSLDGKTLASGSFDRTARVYDAATGKVLATLEHDDPVLAVALAADGKAVATAAARWGDGFYGAAPASVRVWDVATGKPRHVLPLQPNQVFSLALTPDGKSLVTACLSGETTVWDLAKFPAPEEPPPPPARR